MKVTLSKDQRFGNQAYGKGIQDVPDHLYANAAFKDAVKSGSVFVHPRNEEAQRAQASKDARNLQKATSLQATAKALQEERALLSNPKSTSDAFSQDEQEAPEAQPEPTPAPAEPDAKGSKAAQAAPAKSTAAAQATGKQS